MIKVNYTDQNFIEKLLPNKKIKLKMRGETLFVECNLQSYVAPGYESENFNVILDKLGFMLHNRDIFDRS